MLRLPTLRFLPGFGHRAIAIPSSYQHNSISDGQKPLHSLRKPARGGQNLSDRYLRLERSLRGKEAISKELDEYEHIDPSVPAAAQSYGKPAQIFRGFEVPQEPRPPAHDECCMSGCAVCVYDLHEESLEAYREAVSALRSNLSAMNIPEAEWPPSIRTQTISDTKKRKEMVMDAFEEMERALALKRQAQVDAEARKTRIAEKRNELVVKTQQSSINLVLREIYEGLRWVLFGNR